MQQSPKRRLIEVEDHLAEIGEFSKMPRRDISEALTLSLDCIAKNPDDSECYTSAIYWFRAIGAEREARILIKNAPLSIKESVDWQSIMLPSESKEFPYVK